MHEVSGVSPVSEKAPHSAVKAAATSAVGTACVAPTSRGRSDAYGGVLVLPAQWGPGAWCRPVWRKVVRPVRRNECATPCRELNRMCRGDSLPRTPHPRERRSAFLDTTARCASGEDGSAACGRDREAGRARTVLRHVCGEVSVHRALPHQNNLYKSNLSAPLGNTEQQDQTQ
jgi:hypothetical protein